MRLTNIQQSRLATNKAPTLQSFVFQTKADLINLPDVSTLSPGSSILISDTGVQYILDQFKKWQKIAVEETQSSDEIIYDGGELN